MSLAGKQFTGLITGDLARTGKSSVLERRREQADGLLGGRPHSHRQPETRRAQAELTVKDRRLK